MRIADVATREFSWNQPSMWKSHYQLFSSGTLLADLTYSGLLQNRARIESGDGCWDLRYRGFWQRQVDFTPCGSDQIIATYQLNFWKGGGLLVFPFDRTLKLNANLWRNEITLTMPESDQALVRCTRPSIWRISGVITIEPGASFLPALPLTVMLCWFAQVQQIRDQMAAAAA